MRRSCWLCRVEHGLNQLVDAIKGRVIIDVGSIAFSLNTNTCLKPFSQILIIKFINSEIAFAKLEQAQNTTTYQVTPISEKNQDEDRCWTQSTEP